MHTRERTFVVRAGLAAAVLACCALTWSSHAGEGKVELFAEAPVSLEAVTKVGFVWGG